MGWKHRDKDTSPAARGETTEPYEKRPKYRQHPEPIEGAPPVLYPRGYQDGTEESRQVVGE